MNYQLNFYYGLTIKEATFLGSQDLADAKTYNHYKSLIEHNIPFNVWFENFTSERCYRNILVDSDSKLYIGKKDHATESLYILCSNYSKLIFLTKEEFNNQNRIEGLIAKLDKDDISRLLK